MVSVLHGMRNVVLNLCIVFRGPFDITIKISDTGGGMKRNIVNHVFDYLFTTAGHVDIGSEVVGEGGGKGLESEKLPMHGLGYGLPLSRLYVRYFQGDIRLMSVDGYGTDVYIYLKSIPDDAREHLPVFSQTVASKRAEDSTKVADWTSKELS